MNTQSNTMQDSSFGPQAFPQIVSLRQSSTGPYGANYGKTGLSISFR